MSGGKVPSIIEESDFDKNLELKLRGVQGGVRKEVVTRIRRLVEKDPKMFVANLRRWFDMPHND
jgi:hypothetical protein